MRRPGYREFIEWIASNDDCEWLTDENGSISVTLAMVASLFDVSDERATKDLQRVHAKVWESRK